MKQTIMRSAHSSLPSTKEHAIEFQNRIAILLQSEENAPSYFTLTTMESRAGSFGGRLGDLRGNLES